MSIPTHLCHNSPFSSVITFVNAPIEAVADIPATEVQFDLDSLFRTQYPRIARVIARVVRDHARAEELAVEVFLKLWRHPQAQIENAEGWLYRVAVRLALDELRRQTRRSRYEQLLNFVRGTPTPEELHAATEEQDRVRLVLSAMHPRRAELLVLRSHDLSYEELASALALNPASVGTLLGRAQQAFRKEYISRYGEK
ncbi:MAG TPA: sigma-70 family RNA polymerase sigma factor [Candidatus Acidoferrales bacterium]|jgi:RNA polymerase sigma-70 factor (ECF subfamily)|nr:sigma-70 family RNA polymerase sigma factor [Candidatus Acidoferrales bacterium]